VAAVSKRGRISGTRAHSGYEPSRAQIKQEEKSALIISNFSSAWNLFLCAAPAPIPVFHLSVGRTDAESQQPAIFGIGIHFDVEICETVATDIRKPAIISAPEGGVL
jgi:hypothetical protein